MKPITEPIRLLDARSDASDELRRVLAHGRDALSPSHEQLGRLEAVVAGIGALAPGAAVGGATGVAKGAFGQWLAKGAVVKLAVLLAIGGGAAGGSYVIAKRAGSRPAATSLVTDSPAPGPAAAPPRSSVSIVEESRPAPSPAEVAPFDPGSSALPSGVKPSLGAPPPAGPPTLASARHATAGEPSLPSDPLSTEPAPLPETELALVTRARGMVATNPGGALQALDAHRSRFPHGNFEQEREVLAIEALVRLGRRDEARARAGAFAVAFPQSAHRRRIGTLLGDDAPAR
jgi:hypothetical protein